MSFLGPNSIWYQERKRENVVFVVVLFPCSSRSSILFFPSSRCRISTSSLQFELEVRGTTDLFSVAVNLLDLRFKVADEEEGDEKRRRIQR